MRLRFTKMHGIGNDFVMVDAISQKVSINSERARILGDRRFGVGCDQILIVEPPQTEDADFKYRIFNRDGSEVENCGNGARCFALFVRSRGLTTKTSIRVETAGGMMTLHVRDDDQVTVDMGIPQLTPSEIPFDAEAYATTYPLQLNDRQLDISAVSMGNPHAVTCVDDVANYPVETIGAEVEAHRQFPKKVNAGFMEIVSESEIRLRVFERAAGETLACGTGACAAVVAGIIQKKLASNVKVHLPGGTLLIEWEGEGKPVRMTGPATFVFNGQIKI